MIVPSQQWSMRALEKTAMSQKKQSMHAKETTVTRRFWSKRVQEMLAMNQRRLTHVMGIAVTRHWWKRAKENIAIAIRLRQLDLATATLAKTRKLSTHVMVMTAMICKQSMLAKVTRATTPLWSKHALGMIVMNQQLSMRAKVPLVTRPSTHATASFATRSQSKHAAETTAQRIFLSRHALANIARRNARRGGGTTGNCAALP
jgi:hypothetical protein